jgi:hypothetical protein
VEAKNMPQMPPGKPLSGEEIALLKSWINEGATWADSKAAPATSTWWSFRKPQRPAVPTESDTWVKSPIDAFVLSKLRANGLKPAAAADRAALLRRAYFDLTGLPPTHEQTQKFVADQRPDAFARVVDELLASPHYGEKWGRHWLDLVRYADTAGFETDSYMSDVWRYRDYVIESFNQDKPYDTFVREQIAGDEFSPEDPNVVTGTGLYCVGPNRDLFPDQADINRVEILTDYVDTTAAVFQGLTAGCARCHDHKFDPISQQDYYRVQALFAPAARTKIALNRLGSLSWDISENTREIKLREIGDEIRASQKRCRSTISDAKLSRLSPEIIAAIQAPDDQRTPRQKELATANSHLTNVSDDEVRACMNPEETAALRVVEKRLVNMFSGYAPKPFACGLNDIGEHSPPTYMPVRGDKVGVRVEPGFFSILGGFDAPPPIPHREATGPIPLGPTTGRRKALAEWITSPDNPLTSRVMVNRIWQYHFGRGLVATPSDYGSRGAAPSHPELLDWLALEFREQGYSMKKMHRLIMLSSAYQQSANASTVARSKDPQNFLLSHFSRRRLFSDEIRDAVLQSTGVLNRQFGGKPVVVPLTKEELFNLIGRPDDAWVVTANRAQHTRRSIYLMQRRTFRLPMMEVYDAPETMLTCARRESSTTAPQSLTLLNGSFAMEQSKGFAEKLVAAQTDDAQLIEQAWRSIFGRDVVAEERRSSLQFLQEQQKQGSTRTAAVTELVRALINTNEFLYVD